MMIWIIDNNVNLWDIVNAFEFDLWCEYMMIELWWLNVNSGIKSLFELYDVMWYYCYCFNS